MNETLTNQLYSKYPDIFRDKDRPMNETCMCWGFSFNDGWNLITNKMLSKLDLIQKVSGIQIIADQAKEKFGTGRFYYHVDDEKCLNKDESVVGNWILIISDIVRSWEYETSITCEVSGKYGELCTKGGWLKTLCKEEAEKLGFEKYKNNISYNNLL